jgi:phospholipid/cholesterol/gamma-HCH transport system substrate-binding protein
VTPAAGHEGGLSVRDQIERYRTAFIAVVTMIVIAAAVGGYILAHENLKLPSWVPVLGKKYFVLKADLQTAQALTPGQGQAVTIAGAKVGEVAGVDLNAGVAVVTMKLTPKYALLYSDATLLMRPKTANQDMTVEVDPGTASSGRLRSGATLPESQTAPNIDVDEFLAGLDAETRAYLQELLAGAGEGLKNNGKALSATLKRFSPTARLIQEIAQQLEIRHANIARSIHNFRLVMEALGAKDKQLAELVDASNAVFAVFAKQEQNVESLLHLLPGTLAKTRTGLGKLATAADVLGPTLHNLLPFARALDPANEATRRLAIKTTPVFKNEIRPFAREILPVINELGPTTQQLAAAFPKLAESFSVLNEFFNELAYNPGPNQAGFIFYLDWANHNLNSVLSSADANGALGRSLTYFNCNVAPLFVPVSKVNPTVNLIVGLLNPPEKAACQSAGILAGAGPIASSARAKPSSSKLRASAGGLFGGLDAHVLGLAGAAVGPSSRSGTSRRGG